MKLFFGKIKPTADDKQIKESYYETVSPMKMGELETGDYAFIISGKAIHLWRAKEKLNIEGYYRMNFEIIQPNLPLNTQKFVAFKYFQLDSSLIVLSIRQSPKAFYPIQLSDSALTEEMLKDTNTYKKEENFRNIRVLQTKKEVEKGNADIQLYFDESQHLNIEKAPFFNPNMFADFIDNLSKEGNGRKMKDKALGKIRKGLEKSILYTYQQLPILRMYDALFNEYGAPDSPETLRTDDEPAIEGRTALPSYELKSFNQIYYGPPGTGKTYIVRNNFCLEEEIRERNQTRIKIDTTRNFWHLAPGEGAHLWDTLKNGEVLGYEWLDKSWGDLNHLTPEKIKEEGWGNFQLIFHFSKVKKGDYICVISGKKLLGITEVLANYSYEEAIKGSLPFQTVRVKWLKQFDPPAYLNSTQTKTFVRLNDGTRWATLLTILRENGFYFNDEESEDNQTAIPKNFSFITFHQSFSYEDFIEGIKPILSDSENDDVEKLQYEIVPGIFYNACEKAAQLAGYRNLQDCLSESKQHRQKKFSNVTQEYYLIIDEINRGNVAAIFGELITLIEDDKRLGTTSEIIVTLPYSKNLFGVPANLRIVGTMNTADRSIEALDAALRRRFSFEEIVPDPESLETEIEGLNLNLRKLLSTINERLEKLLSRDYTIGHAFFIKVTNAKDLKQVFCNKIIPLLQEYFYNDYAKIGLTIGKSFLDVKMKKTVFMPVDHFDASDIEDKPVYSLKNLDDIEETEFLTMIRSIYE
nr:AAA family ATPase [uncultured Chitinophaga sp.]